MAKSNFINYLAHEGIKKSVNGCGINPNKGIINFFSKDGPIHFTKDAKKWIEFALSPDCVNLAQDNGSYQFLVIDNAKPVSAAVKAGLDKIETIKYDFDDAKTNGPKYYAEFFEVIAADDRVKTK